MSGIVLTNTMRYQEEYFVGVSPKNSTTQWLPNQLTTPLLEGGRVPIRLTIKRHFDVEKATIKVPSSSSIDIKFPNSETLQKKLPFLECWILLNTLPPEVMEIAISQLNQLVKDYLSAPGSQQNITQLSKKTSTPWSVVKVKSGFKVNQPAQYSDREKFERLKSEWQEKTEMLSSISKKIKHPAYQEIIAMGEKVIPWILEELEREPGHWFYALSVLSQADPVSAEDNFGQAVEAWLNWGRRKGYIQ